MTWTLGTLIASKDDLSMLDDDERIAAASGRDASDADEAAVKLAKKIAKEAVRSGALGDGPFRITGNGNADPEFGPVFIGLNVVHDDTAEVPTVEELRASRGTAAPDVDPGDVGADVITNGNAAEK